MKASERRYFTATGYPLLDIRNKYLTRPFSSDGVRYCWLQAFSSFEGRPCARFHRVVRATSWRFGRAAYVLGSVGSRPSASARLAASILQMVVVIVKGKEQRGGDSQQAQRTRGGSPWKLVESCHRWGFTKHVQNETIRVINAT
jgi:hypothetical protein